MNIKTAGTSDEMVALMNEGGFDLVTASGDASLRLISGKRVQAVNTDLIPSWKTVDERLQNAAWHTVDGVHYGVPYQWGANVLAYNTKVFPEAPKSWSVVFEEQNLPDGKSNKGRVQAFDGPIYIADAALYLMNKKPELGIKDPYELNEEQYKAALDLLRAQRALVGRYWHDAFIQIDDFKNEGVVASSSWPFQVNILQADKAAMEKTPIASTVPAEGATGWADTTMMHADAAHPNCAYMWLEHSINPKLQGDLAAWFGSVPADLAACKGNALLTDAGCDTNGLGNFDKIQLLAHPGGQVRHPERRLRALLSLGHRHDRRAGRHGNDSAFSQPLPALVGRGSSGEGGSAPRARTGPHPALRATFSRETREKNEKVQPTHDHCRILPARLAAISAACAPSMMSRSTLPRANSSPCSGPRAPARPPACA